MKTLFALAIALALSAYFAPSAFAIGGNSVYIEELTWMQLRDRIGAGHKIAIVPTGGTEQNGPQMALGKHNYIVRYTGGEIARRLGNAVVAPVISYVPEGRVSPPEGHMQFPGTLSVTGNTFTLLLEDTARSLKQHGFKIICFIGDHGGSQAGQQEVATKLTNEWRSDGVIVLNVSDYYLKHGQDRWVEMMGLKIVEPGAHAGFEDTSELLAIYTPGVLNSQLGVRTEKDYKETGAMGDSSLANAKYGKKLLNLKIEAAIQQIQNASSAAR